MESVNLLLKNIYFYIAIFIILIIEFCGWRIPMANTSQFIQGKVLFLFF